MPDTEAQKKAIEQKLRQAVSADLRRGLCRAAEAGALQQARRSQGQDTPARSRTRANARSRGKLFKELEAEIVRGAILEGPAAHRRPRHQDHPADLGRGRRAAARPRLGAVHPRRDPGLVVTTLGTGEDEQIIDALEGEYRAELHAALQFPALFDRRSRSAWARPAGAKSATASSPGARSTRCCRRRRASPTPSASSRRSPNRTAPPRWRPCAARRCR